MAQRVWRPGEELIWTLVAHNADGILVVGETGQIAFANEAAAALFGQAADELAGQTFGYPVLGSDRAEVRIPQAAPPSSDQPPSSSQDTARPHSIIAEMRVVPVDWQGGLSYLISLRDVTERCDRQQQLEARANELEMMNQELEAFCQTVSHDLWGYSRHVEKYSRLILQRFGDKFDTEGRSYLQLLDKAGQRMKGLVEDLLQLSRVRYRPFRPTQINLSQLAEETVDYLQLTQPERSATIHIEPGMHDLGDKRQMEIVLENLLGNAWKYTHAWQYISNLGPQSQAHPSHLPGTSTTTSSSAVSRPAQPSHIEIGRLYNQTHLRAQPPQSLPPGHPIYFIQDNGIGFDPTLMDQVFLPFHRLLNHTHPEGNGVGLAIVKRIIRRHRGQVWAHSTPGQGSIFYFTLGG